VVEADEVVVVAVVVLATVGVTRGDEGEEVGSWLRVAAALLSLFWWFFFLAEGERPQLPPLDVPTATTLILAELPDAMHA